MICHCPTCGRDWWKYPGALPDGYCSLICKETRKRAPKPEPGEEKPEDVLREFRAHLIGIHNDLDINGWHDCADCEQFEERLSAALGSVAV